MFALTCVARAYVARTHLVSRATRARTTMAAAKADYLVVGAGAPGMAFLDTLLAHTAEPVTVTLIDQRR